MKADLTRRTHCREKHYGRVIHQQGRVPLDADLNEQFEITEHLAAVQAVDVIGRAGVPKGDSFRVEPSPDKKDLLLFPGTLHVDGVLCEAEATSVPATLTAPRVVQLDALTLAGRALAPGEWVEVFTSSKSRVYRVRGIDRANRSITLGPSDDLVADFGTAPALLRRRPSYLAQADQLRPPGITQPVPVDPDQLTDAELPSIDAATITPGTYQAYLDVWRRHVTALEDSSLREIALGGPDTCTRAKTVWQLALRRLGDVGTPADCGLPVEAPAGALRARAKLPATGAHPCIIAPGASYRRLENQLYRVEIHGGGTLTGGVPSASLTFKFSRDNGSVVVAWLGSTATELTVESTGRDATLGLASGQWIELIDDERELAGTPGTLVQIDSVTGNTIVMKPGTATGTTTFADFRGHPRVRRWDQVASPTLAVERDDTVDEGYVELEDGVQVRFEDGAYRSGDYWTIPARTISADVEWPLDLDGKPLARAPEGIVHHFAPLAVLSWSGTEWSPSLDGDCRSQFPPVTGICAEDVCVEGDPCGLGVTTVQEAIENLCERQDLPFHNQHLHGWGVVCGLQTNCVPLGAEVPEPREHVIVKSGYALHPTGIDIKVDHDVVYPIVDAVIEAGIATPGADGKIPDLAVSVWIDAGGGLHVEPFDPAKKGTLAGLLEGTILLDFYEHCIQRVLDFLAEQLKPAPEEEDDLVSPARKRLTTFLNLAWQFFSPQNGRSIYLSGERAPGDEGPNHEDKILRDFFEGLRKLLQSETFCAMFEDVVFPEYDVYKPAVEPATVPHPSTIFGSNNHTRLRIHPASRFAFTCRAAANVSGGAAAAGKIAVFDLEAGLMVAEADFPVAGAEVQDVAFNPGTSQIYAAAWIGDAKTDSAIVRGTIESDGRVTWSQNQVTCSRKIVTLASGAVPRNRLFAAARGSGVFMFDMDHLDPNPPQVGIEAKTTGHLILQQRGSTEAVLYFGVHTTNTNPVAYDRVFRVSVAPSGSASAPTVFTLPVTAALKGEAHDDLEAMRDTSNPAAPRAEVYVVAEGAGGANKSLLVFQDASPAMAPAVVALQADTENRLAYNTRTRQLFVTYEDAFHGRQYSPLVAPPVLRDERHPLQIGAISVATGNDGRTWYVLNWLSATITAIPAELPAGPDGAPLLQPWQSTIDSAKLAAYRAAVIQAFLKMIGRFLQYLKDCFCELLLVECPHPAEKKVYLADVSFKGGEVYQICNFSRRRYVHTFPTVEYWLSVIPLFPLLKKAVGSFCCSVLPGFFDKLAAPSPQRGERVSVSMARSGLQWASSLNLRTKLDTTRAQLVSAASLGRTALAERMARPPPGVSPTVNAGMAHTELIGRPVSEVAASAKRRGVVVNQVTVADPATAVRTLAATAFVPTRIKPGTAVDLVTDSSGRVLGYRAATAAPPSPVPGMPVPPGEAPAPARPPEGVAPPPPVERAEIERLTNEVGALRAELQALKARLPRRKPR